MAEKSLRSDARENRRRILDIAREAFAAAGDTSLNEIARRAGVGPGTLYRHFPTREDLILAVYRDELQQLADMAPALLAEHPPVQALRRWLDRVGQLAQLKYGVAEVIHAASTASLETEAYELITGAIGVLLEAGTADGALRADVDPEDFLLLISFLWRLDPATGGEKRAAHLFDLIMEGLLSRDA